MYKLLQRKCSLAFVIFFCVCICVYALSSAAGGGALTASVLDSGCENSNSLSNSGFPKAYFMPDRSDVFIFKDKKVTVESIYAVPAFLLALFVSLIYCVRYVDVYVRTRVVLLI